MLQGMLFWVQYAKNVLFRPRAPLLTSPAWRERRGLAIFNATFVRKGDAVHEVLRPSGLADVNAAAADFVLRLKQLNDALAERSSRLSRDSIFTGQIAGVKSTIRHRYRVAWRERDGGFSQDRSMRPWLK
jgi:hypothetical protein